MFTIANYMCWNALRCRNHFMINDQNPEIMSGYEFLNNYPTTVSLGMFQSSFGFIDCFYIDRSAFSVVSTQRFNHNWKTDFVDGIYQIFFVHANRTSCYRNR